MTSNDIPRFYFSAFHLQSLSDDFISSPLHVIVLSAAFASFRLSVSLSLFLLTSLSLTESITFLAPAFVGHFLHPFGSSVFFHPGRPPPSTSLMRSVLLTPKNRINIHVTRLTPAILYQ